MALPVMLDALADAMREELQAHLLPFWTTHVLDTEHGGFVGQITHDGHAVPEADKGVILNTRLLWTYSAAARVLGDGPCLQLAERARRYLERHFVDDVHGGLFWMLDHKGAPVDAKKQVYAQAFGIYGFSEHYRATEEEASREHAVALFRLMDTHREAVHGGYLEAFDRTWQPLADMRLSEKDANAPKSMNTHLHVLEAYTNLYRIWPDPTLGQRLAELLRLFLDHIINPSTHHLQLFFAKDWAPEPAAISYGHDIEASWLLHEAAQVLGEPALESEVTSRALAMAYATLEQGLDQDGALLHERSPKGHLDTDKHWWPQVEAIVGFVNAYTMTQDETFLRAASRVWTFIQNHLVDRAHGEWFWRVSREHVPIATEDKVGPWKGPYHNVRACLELIGRASQGKGT